jgi:hypothetical protein
MKFYSMDWYIPQLKRIQYKISDHTDDKSVFYDDAIAEIEKLRAENARLTDQHQHRGVPGRRLGADQRPQGPHGAWRFCEGGRP